MEYSEKMFPILKIFIGPHPCDHLKIWRIFYPKTDHIPKRTPKLLAKKKCLYYDGLRTIRKLRIMLI
jgi:hypothetical protein